MEELNLIMMERFMIRRMKTDVLTQLPSKQRKMVILDPNLVKSKTREMKDQAKLMSGNSLSKMERRGVLLEWFHSTSNAKSHAVQDYIKVSIGQSISERRSFERRSERALYDRRVRAGAQPFSKHVSSSGSALKNWRARAGAH